MKKITTVLAAILFFTTLQATEGIQFQKNLSWSQIKAKALKEKKMIFFDAYTTWCGPCKYLEENVYTDRSVATYYNASYINVKFDMETGEGIKLAEEFGIDSYPTLLFFSFDGKPVHKYIGAMKAPQFLELGKDAKDPAKQYFSLKQKVLDQTATTKDFINWTEQASDLEDENRGTIASQWLSVQQDILGNAELAKATFSHTDVSETQLSYLYANRSRIMTLMGWDAKKTDDKLYGKLFTLALDRSDNGNKTELFKNVISTFAPAKLNYAFKDLQVKLSIHTYHNKDKAVQIISNSVVGKDRIHLDEMAYLLIDSSPYLDAELVSSMEAVLSHYQFTDFDKGHEWGLYLALVICHSKTGSLDKVKFYAEKACNSENLPGEFREVMKASLGQGD